MKYIKTILTIILISFSISLFPSENTMLYLDRTRLNSITDFSYLPSSITANMLQQLPTTLHSKSVDKYNVFELDNRIYAIGNGFFDVLQWNDSSWVNLYTSDYYGYNFEREIFTYNNEIYAIGGYGYWNAHSNLIKFDTDLGHWSMISTVDKPDHYQSDCVGKIGDSIISFFGTFIDESRSIMEQSETGFLLNLQDMKWEKAEQYIDVPIFDPNCVYGCCYDLKDYMAIEISISTRHGLYVLNKSTLEIFFYHRDAIDLSESPIVLIDGNKATFFMKNKGLISINFSTIVPNKKLVGKLVPASKQSLSILWIFLIVATILMIIIIVIIMKKRTHVKRINGTGNGSKIIISKLTEEILQYKGKEITVTEINSLLGISNLNYEIRRQKRSKMINEINFQYKALYGNELITRLRNVKDKRHFLYRISDHDNY